MADFCRAIVSPNTDACLRPAPLVVVFGDGQQIPACELCALALRQQAESFGTSVDVRKKGAPS